MEDTLAEWSTTRDLWMLTTVDKDVPGPAAHCGRCKTNLWSTTDGGTCFFSCKACSGEIFCYACCVMDHRENPLHFLKEWTGTTWQNITLADISFIHQLGHSGLDCNTPAKPVHTMRVIDDTTGIQLLNYRFCGCTARGTDAEQLVATGLRTSAPTNQPTAATRSLLEQLSSLWLD
ncbi:hypothetical protein C8R43DRAFT_1124766 [Mycena crocata]|nr:hypothetical protein C8R43DRAFT_1124766 [Mycena crocata]